MRLVRTFVSGLLVLGLAAPGFAQEGHVLDSRMLARAVDLHVADQQADRAAIREALGRPEVRDLAARVGMNLDAATRAVDAMSGTDLAQAASAARQVNHTLVGGASTIVISTTTVIIALLLVLLIIVAVK